MNDLRVPRTSLKDVTQDASSGESVVQPLRVRAVSGPTKERGSSTRTPAFFAAMRNAKGGEAFDAC